MGFFPAGLSLPVLADVTPPAGEGGATLTVTGSDFTPETVVLVDGVPLGDLAFVNESTVRGTVPPRPRDGVVDVTVVTQVGRTPAPGRFVYGSIFLRGDTNQSGGIDLSDAIFILKFLYGGGEAPGCPDAADTNNDGQIDIADAIALLSYLFSNGASPNPVEADC